MTIHSEDEKPCSLYQPIKGRETEKPDCCNCNNGAFGEYPENC